MTRFLGAAIGILFGIVIGLQSAPAPSLEVVFRMVDPEGNVMRLDELIPTPATETIAEDVA